MSCAFNLGKCGEYSILSVFSVVTTVVTPSCPSYGFLQTLTFNNLKAEQNYVLEMLPFFTCRSCPRHHTYRENKNETLLRLAVEFTCDYQENCVWIHSFILLLHIFVCLISLFWRAAWVFSPFVSLIYVPSCWKTSIFVGKVVFTWVRIIVKCMLCLKLNIETWW